MFALSLRATYFIFLSVASIVLFKVIFFTKYTNNVCKTFDDYYNERDNNENCYYNPDQHLTVPEIIRRHGYPLETYSVITRDGYVLTLFRIPYGKGNKKAEVRKPIFLQHGFVGNSASFTALGESSLSFILANEGYDVWLGNFRGTMYSSNHTTLANTDNQYWNFTQHELAVYDLAAQIEFVRKTTKQKMIFVAYSMATISICIYSATYPNIASDQIDLNILIAPSVFIIPGNVYLKFAFPYWPYIKKFIFSNRYHLKEVVKHVCYPHMFQLKLCMLFTQMAFGFNDQQHNPETLPVAFIQLVDTFVFKPFDHMMQFLLSGQFKQYDHGIEGNKRIYGSNMPPEYKLSNIKIPAYMIRADNDVMFTKQGVEKLYENLPRAATPFKIHVIADEHFNHLDFLMGKDATTAVYNHIVNFLG